MKTGLRTRNLQTDTERRRVLNAIKASEAKLGAPKLGSQLDSAIKPYTQGKTARVNETGERCESTQGTVVPEQVVVHRGDGGAKVEVLTEPWRGAPPVMISRSIRARVPALLDNGELVFVEEESGWRLRHKEYVKIKRTGAHACTGFVQKVHLDALSLASHPKSWKQPKPRTELLPNCHFLRESIIKDTRAPPRRNAKWQWAGKNLHCPVLLTDARDLPDGTVVATPHFFEDRKPAADLVSGFHPIAAPTQVSVLPR
eukprot:TRINITY_DN67976_c0_g1_i1.p1 TRINITY_DN67976_c0_g1~~TRINITY_DN67976_c0_g1_i1.p1  ORF type:complete len:257 (+),score=102.86 TRINITY_DN67976_c0_g1_i1:74-844(+)